MRIDLEAHRFGRDAADRWHDSAEPPINPPGCATRMLADAEARLARLEKRVQADLHTLRHPETDWMPTRRTPDGAPMLDVVIVGAGQGGLAVAALLMRERVQNILVIDKAPQGREGVWSDFARMPVIRSPKHYPGPDMGIPSLTYEAWHRTVFGDRDWDILNLVPTDLWVHYLDWIRAVLQLPVRNDTALVGVSAIEDGLALQVHGCAGGVMMPDASVKTLFTRRLVLATGHDGTGRWWMPPFIQRLPPQFRAHAADPIDFKQLAGKRVAVLGVGASAGDNSICALEAGAASVQMFCRRDTHRRQQVYRWCITAGFMRHFNDLSDAWRWRFMHYILNIRMGMPPETWKRVDRFQNFFLHTQADWQSVAVQGEYVRIQTAKGHFDVDFIIAATGHDQDLAARAELAGLADKVARWSDVYTPPSDLADERLGRYPYLGQSFELRERVPGTAPELSRIHDFTFGPTMSFGPSGCSISTLRLSAPMLVAGVTRGLFTEDVDLHYEDLLSHPNMIP